MISAAGWFHLAFFGVIIPWLAWKSRARLAARGAIRRMRHFQSVLAQLLFFLLLSLLVARVQRIPVWVPPGHHWVPWLLAALFVAAAVALMYPRWRANVLKRDPRVRYFMPTTGPERGLWLAVAAAAGVSEEVTYRWVLFALLWLATGSPVVSAILASIVFGMSHAVQGWKTVGIVTLIALCFHGIVMLDGTLYPAIAAHVVYDTIAGLTYGRLGRELAYHEAAVPPAESVPAPLPAP